MNTYILIIFLTIFIYYNKMLHCLIFNILFISLIEYFYLLLDIISLAQFIFQLFI